MNKKLFSDGIKELGIAADKAQINMLSEYSLLLKEWNENINLTAITDDDGISIKHFLDSVLLLKYIDIGEGQTAIDVGTGAGFPGLPLKIMRQDIDLTLLDSLNKRINFLNCVNDNIGLKDTRCIHGRAEELARDNRYRERFDLAVSRAVANMTVLSEYCLPYVRVGGRFVALKANDADDEIAEAKPMIGTLGGRVAEVIKAPLPGSDIVRTLAVIEKVKPTPKAFPRTAKKIKQSQKN